MMDVILSGFSAIATFYSNENTIGGGADLVVTNL